MPKAGETTDFICPAGYTKCPNCCDIQTDCGCDEECGRQYPGDFECSIAPGDDEYTEMGDGAVCPGGYTECENLCDLHPSCREADVCGDLHTYPPDLPCTLPKRELTAGEGRSELIIVKDCKAFNDAELGCVAKGVHLASIHGSEDFEELRDAAERAYVTDAVFIGAYEESEGDWRWTDGTPWTRVRSRPWILASMVERREARELQV